MCIFMYVAADHPLDDLTESAVRLGPVKKRERDLLPSANVYLAFGGCACDLTLDGVEPVEQGRRQELLDVLEDFLVEATKRGAVDVLVTDGDRRTRPEHLSLSVGEFRNFDFDSAWDRPTHLTITHG